MEFILELLEGGLVSKGNFFPEFFDHFGVVPDDVQQNYLLFVHLFQGTLELQSRFLETSLQISYLALVILADICKLVALSGAKLG